MDLHSLPRRALQLLSKRNKIPANLTNIAMADALHSLQTVEGLDGLQQESQTPIKTPTRPPNPPRSCRRNSAPISLPSPNGRKKRDQRELPSSSMSKRRSTVRPIRASSRKEGDDDKEEDPTGKLPPFDTLVHCAESAGCLKTYCRRRWDGSGKLIERVTLEKPMLGCNSSVRQIANKKRTQRESPSRSRTVSARRASRRKKWEEEEEEEDPIRKQLPCNTLLPCGERSVCLKTYCRRRCNSSVRENATAFDSAESAIGGVMECTQVGEERRRSIGVQVDIGDLDNRLLDISSSVDLIPGITDCDNTKVSNQCLDLIKKDQETNLYFLPADDHLDKECVDSSCQQNHQSTRLLPEPSPESSNMRSNVRDLIRSQVTLLPETDKPIVKSHEFDACVGGLALNAGQILENIEGDKMESIGVHSNGREGADMDRKNGEAKGSGETIPESSGMIPNVKDLTRIQETLLPVVGDPIVKSRERMKSVGFHANGGVGPDIDRENRGKKNCGETRVEIKTEKQSEKKRDLSGLSLRKLRLLYKENKEVLKLETQGDSEEEEGKGHREQKQSIERASLDGVSLRKLKFLYKNKVTNNRNSEVLTGMKN